MDKDRVMDRPSQGDEYWPITSPSPNKAVDIFAMEGGVGQGRHTVAQAYRAACIYERGMCQYKTKDRVAFELL